MLFIYLVLLVLYSPCAKSLTQRIIGGTEASILQHPYQVSLHSDGVFICGGSILNENTIITAAHCLYKKNPRNLYIRAGSAFRRFGTIRKISRVFQHPLYNHVNIDYDVAILKLQAPLVMNNIIRPIPLQEEGTVLPRGSIAVVTGWGSTSEGGILSEALRKTYVKVMTKEECSKRFLPGDITNRMLCAYWEGHDSCQGDSGGPLVVNRRLVGIVSWGYGCARKDMPGVYSKIPSFTTWIKSHM